MNNIKLSNNEKLRKHFIIVFSSFSAIVFMVFGFYYTLYNNIILGIFEVSTSIVFLINLFFLITKNTIEISAKIVVFFVMLISLFVFYNGGIENTGNLWLTLVPMFPTLLLKYEDGLKWLYIYSTILIAIILLGMFEILSLKFNFLELRQTLIVFILFSVLIYNNEKIKYLDRELLIQTNNEIIKKDKLLYEHAKNAQMGEMLSMIAHQWRQPLNAISASAINLSLLQEFHQLDDKTILKHSEFIQDSTQKMSGTINTFMDFFKPKKEKTDFMFSEIIDEIDIIIGPQLKNRNIELIYDNNNDIMLHSYKAELSHMLLNIIINARDAYEDKEIKDKTIEVICFKDDKKGITIQIKDKAGGIPEEVIRKIFNPYFTTKEQGKGIGIGLHMAKRIVEEIFKGMISANNVNDGAIFTIELSEVFIDNLTIKERNNEF